MNKQKIVAVIILLLIISAIYWGAFLYVPADSVRVKILIAPSDAILKIDNQTYKTTGNIILKNNQTYKIEVSRDNFKTQTLEQSFDKNSKYENDRTLAVALESTNQQGEEIAKQQEKLYYQIEHLAGEYGTDFANNFSNKHPITDSLPIQTGTYSIGYIIDTKNNKISDQSNITITIHATSSSRMAALRKLQELNLDFGQYQIIFYDLNQHSQINPYEETADLNL